MSQAPGNRDVARIALEQVRARGDMELAPQCYAEEFADHVGHVDYHGLEGVRRSTASYRALIDDLRFDVVDHGRAGGSSHWPRGSSTSTRALTATWSRCAGSIWRSPPARS